MDRLLLYIALLVTLALTTSAFPTRSELNEEAAYYGLRDDEKEARNLDGIGGGNLLRDLEAALRARPALFSRQMRNLDSLSGVTFGGNKRFDSLSGRTFGTDKRNMDEIDRTGFNSFVKKKKNFDEIDRTGFDGFVKRNFDEIDRVGFGSFVKREVPRAPKPL